MNDNSSDSTSEYANLPFDLRIAILLAACLNDAGLALQPVTGLPLVSRQFRYDCEAIRETLGPIQQLIPSQYSQVGDDTAVHAGELPACWLPPHACLGEQTEVDLPENAMRAWSGGDDQYDNLVAQTNET